MHEWSPRRAARRLCRGAVHSRPAGTGSRDPRTCTNRFMAFAIPFVWIADPARQRRGIDLIVGTPQRISAGQRRPARQELPLARLRDGPVRGLRARRRDRRADRCRWPRHRGPGLQRLRRVCGERRAGRVVTPAAGVLEGISRRTAIELARAAGFAVQEAPWSVAELRAPRRCLTQHRRRRDRDRRARRRAGRPAAARANSGRSRSNWQCGVSGVARGRALRRDCGLPSIRVNRAASKGNVMFTNSATRRALPPLCGRSRHAQPAAQRLPSSPFRRTTNPG